MQSVNRVGILERLKDSIQLLACTAEIQLKILPDSVCKADELALDFDLWREAALRNFRSELTTDQISSMDNIDRALLVLTHMGPQHGRRMQCANLWSGSIFARLPLWPLSRSVGL